MLALCKTPKKVKCCTSKWNLYQNKQHNSQLYKGGNIFRYTKLNTFAIRGKGGVSPAIKLFRILVCKPSRIIPGLPKHALHFYLIVYCLKSSFFDNWHTLIKIIQVMMGHQCYLLNIFLFIDFPLFYVSCYHVKTEIIFCVTKAPLLYL